MGTRGRKSTHPEIDLQPGERADRVKPTPASATGDKPIAPSHLDKVAKAEFARIVEALEEQGTLSRTDAQSIALYADCFSRWVRARTTLAELPEDYVTLESGIIKAHPVHDTINKCVGQMTRLLVEFGLTPQSRKKVPMTKPKETASGWEGLI